MRRRHWTTLSTLGVVGVATVVLAASTANGAPARVPALQDPGSPCLVVVQDKSVMPSTILLGEKAKITLRAAVLCAGEVGPIHLVLVLDEGASMAGAKIEQMKDSATSLVNGLDLRNYPNRQVGVVAFSGQPRTAVSLTNDEGKIRKAIHAVKPGSAARLDLGIRKGAEVLRTGRDTGRWAVEGRDVMIVFADGQSDNGCAPAAAEASRAKGQGVLLMTVCVGTDCDTSCMSPLATSKAYYFQAGDTGGMLRVVEQIARVVVQIAVKQISVTDALPENMRLVPGSAQPLPDFVDALGKTVAWKETPAVTKPSAGVTYTLEVEPMQAGRWPTNTEAKVDFVDTRNRSGSTVFPIPWINVLEPNLVPTPTKARPTATRTAVRPSTTPTPSATTVPPQRRSPIYLPVVLRRR
jgi:uncharacterized protein YegL